jgi:hypothetical protein
MDYDDETCEHDCLDGHVCVACGLTLENIQLTLTDFDHSKHHLRFRNYRPKNFEKDLAALKLSDDILFWIHDKVAQAPKAIFKPETRVKLIFAYVYLAHLHLGKPLDPWQLATMVGLSRGDIDDSLKIVSGISSWSTHNSQTGSLAAAVVVLTPEMCLESFGQQLDIPDLHLVEMKRLARLLIERNELLLDEDPKKMAIGILRYYYEFYALPFSQLSRQLGYTSLITRKYAQIVTCTLGPMSKPNS